MFFISEHIIEGSVTLHFLFQMEILGLGKTTSHASGMKFGIKPKDRRQHMYLIGQTGTGKITLLKNMAIQDYAARARRLRD